MSVCEKCKRRWLLPIAVKCEPDDEAIPTVHRVMR